MNSSDASAASSAQAASLSDPPAQQEQESRADHLPGLVWVIAAAFVALELAVSRRYGFMQDELYFIEAGRHLALGYVDQPPLMPLLDRTTDFLGVNPTEIRIIPALAGGAFVLIAAHLPPILSGQNGYWMWGPGRASDRTVLVVDALGTLRRYFASCRLLTTFHAPYRVRNDWTGIPIGVCTGPVATWTKLWPHLKYYG